MEEKKSPEERKICPIMPLRDCGDFGIVPSRCYEDACALWIRAYYEEDGYHCAMKRR